MKTITATQLRSMLHDGGEIALIDVREAGQFGDSHLLFATPLPYSRLELGIGALVPRTTVRVVLCDDGESGVAALAGARLKAMGYTDIGVLAGGTGAWAAAGYVLFAGVNVPSKLFGELVEHAYHTPRVSARELARMKDAGEDFVLLDGRPFSEYKRMTIPGSTCCPNAELPYRIAAMVTNPATKIIVNCAGRTRSIIGAQTLINFGIDNPVYALENGTQGWYLAEFDLEHDARRRYPDEIDPAALPGLRAAARELMQRFAVPTVTAREVEAWLEQPDRTTYLCDVRSSEEYLAGSIPGAMHAPGGQLIQATDQWIGVRNARVVLIDHEGVRAPAVASWLRQLGYEACVLEGGTAAGLVGRRPLEPALPRLPEISAAALRRALDSGNCTVFDLGPSMDFRKAHIPGSRWSIRPRLPVHASGVTTPIVLVAADPMIARLAATELIAAGTNDIRLLEGGIAAWKQAGYDTESSPNLPLDADCIDYLFFVHDRHAGNREAMRQYLAWETGLLAQIDEQDKAAFRIGPAD